MEDKGLGSLIVYIILAVITVVGSLQGKKKPVPGKTVTRKPAAKPQQETVKWPEPPPVRQVYNPTPATDREPWRGLFEEEGVTDAGKGKEFTDEGSKDRGLGPRYAEEGSANRSIAYLYASEGEFSVSESQITDAGIDLNDGESSIIEGYDYNAPESPLETEARFNLKKAVVYSVILNRNEYSF